MSMMEQEIFSGFMDRWESGLEICKDNDCLARQTVIALKNTPKHIG
jgi:hypothetical protein